MPEKKVTAAALGAAITTILVWILDIAGVDLPAEVAAAISLVVVAIAGYFAPHTHRPDLAASTTGTKPGDGNAPAS